jgi:hypothetical protein
MLNEFLAFGDHKINVLQIRALSLTITINEQKMNFTVGKLGTTF